ncbi:MAG: hypothetical protein NTW21_10845 [Verrucomicrobia bacterium]|nr:hypothetical protein [Verrucomicrobiota bacterium]
MATACGEPPLAWGVLLSDTSDTSDASDAGAGLWFEGWWRRAMTLGE